MAETERPFDRRAFVAKILRAGGAIGFAGAATAWAVTRGEKGETVWQLDPEKCTACGNCATYCVLEPSAVKCLHNFVMCGYCDLCTGYFEPEPNALNSGAENQLCPVGALLRNYVEDPYFEYSVDKDLCIGCGKCVKGCSAFGNGSLYMQVAQDLCVRCNECAIAAACPSEAFERRPASDPYILKGPPNPEHSPKAEEAKTKPSDEPSADQESTDETAKESE